jgi:serine/threonine-protein kinase HipA
MPNLDLFLHDQFVGSVQPALRNKTRVTLDVDKSYREEIVLSESFATLPGRRPRTESISNFLGGYVPEGNHRQAMAAKRGIDNDDLFALLREFGGSIAGAVTLRHPDESTSYVPDYEPLDDDQLEKKLQQALDDSDQAIAADSRSTLPGYQPKVLVGLVDGQWAYPHGRAHSTYILKPQVPARPSRLFDEYYAHLLTRHIGLSRYASEICVAGGMTYLAIERFDRIVIDEKVHTYHQEDMAQAMSLDWRDTDGKFQQPLWPNDPKRATARRIAETLSSIPRGDAAVEQWLRQLTFHVAIGNNDAHAKNVALMHLSTGAELSQVYDALPNFFQEGLVKWDLALAIDGIFDHRHLSVENIVAEAKSWGVIAVNRATELILDTLVALDEAVATIAPPQGISNGVVEQLAWNLLRLISFEEIGERLPS